MSKPRDVRAARCNSWVHYRLEVPDSWAMPKENLFAASPRQKWQLCSEAAGGTGTLWECGALMVKSLPWDLAFFNTMWRSLLDTCTSRIVPSSCPVMQELLYFLYFLLQGPFVVVPFVAAVHRSDLTLVLNLDAELMLKMEILCWLDNDPMFVEIPGEVQAGVNESRGSHH